MPVYDRGPSDGLEVIDRFEGGVGWIAHPDERGRRASHAVVGPAPDGDGRAAADGVWLFDPLDAPGVDDLVGELGTVVGVVVLSGYHSRDAVALARRHGVAVHVPAWLDRPLAEGSAPADVPVRRPRGSVAGFELRRLRPLRAWRETVAYRDADRTLYVPDFLTALPAVTVGEERVAMTTLSRLSPPRSVFADLSPDRLLFGHGPGVHERATAALRSGFEGARRRLPRALLTSLPVEVRMLAGAAR